MKRRWSREGVSVWSLLALFLTFSSADAFSDAGSGRLPGYPGGDYGQVPLSFEANLGQAPREVEFISRGNGFTVMLDDGNALFVNNQSRSGRDVRVSMRLVGANRGTRVIARDRLEGTANYFIGNDPERWRTGVPTYRTVEYRDIYSDIDLVYYGNQRRLEYDFVIRPSANPNNIRLKFSGADRISLEPAGDLVIHTAAGEIRQHKPIAYQSVAGVRRQIPAEYILKTQHTVGFRLGAYDTTVPLTIDPVVSYATYLGGTSHDVVRGIAVDADGSAYVTGETNSIDFPVNTSTTRFGTAGGLDVFVTKVNPAGTAILYSAYVGGNHYDVGYAIAVDASGHAYVVGDTRSLNFPFSGGAFQKEKPSAEGVESPFVLKLDPTGSAIVYATFLGGESSDHASSIAVDSDRHAYVTGVANSKKFPTTAGALSRTLGYNYGYDTFVTKLNATGTELIYSTYLGGSDDSGASIAVDSSGSAYVVGTSNGTFPITRDAYQKVVNNNNNAFVSKLNPGGSELVYSTFFGLSNSGASGVAVNERGVAYITGNTGYPLPTTDGAYQSEYGGGDGDGFIAALDPTGSSLVYSTYIGGNDTEGVASNGIRVDGAGNAYIVGATLSTNFPITSDALRRELSGPAEIFVLKLNAEGTDVLYSSFFGTDQYDHAGGIALDHSSNPNIFIAGSLEGTNLSVTDGAAQMAFAGGDIDGFVAKIDSCTAPPKPSVTKSTDAAGVVTLTCSPADSYSWTHNGSVVATTQSVTATSGVYTVTVSNSGRCLTTSEEIAVAQSGQREFTFDDGNVKLDFIGGISLGAVVSVEQIPLIQLPSGYFQVDGLTTGYEIKVSDGKFNTVRITFRVPWKPSPTRTEQQEANAFRGVRILHGEGGKLIEVDQDHNYNAADPAKSTVTTKPLTSLSPFYVVRSRRPRVVSIEAPLRVAIGSNFSTTALFRDSDSSDLHTAMWEWGDGTSSAGVVIEPESFGHPDLLGQVTESHLYATVGHYTAKLTLSDNTAEGGEATGSVTVTIYDPAPVAADDSYSVTENESLSVAATGVLSNDTDPDGQSLTAVMAAGPAHGTVTLSSDGGFTYTPNTNYYGTDSFSYKASDGSVQSTAATVSIRVAPNPGISINDVSIAEDSGSAVFTVSLAHESTETITVNYATVDSTATAGSDYAPASGTVTFAPGVTAQTVTVQIIADTTYEPDEQFFVNLSSAVSAVITDGQAVGTISGDDGQPTISVDDPAVLEGASGTTTPMVFNVTLSNPSYQMITVSYDTTNQTALAGKDYMATSGTLTFVPGETSKTVTVTITGDKAKETDELLDLNLRDPVNATIALQNGFADRGTGTIRNDD